jgi:AraC-like DNA-binding protein
VLPSNFHKILLILQAVVYMLLIIRILQTGARVKEDGLYIRQTSTYKWMKAFTFLLGINFLPAAAFLLGPPSFFYQGTQFVLIILALSFLVINLYLFFKPEILYGIPQKLVFAQSREEKPEVKSKTADRKEPVFNIENVLIEQKTEKKTEFFNLERYKPSLEAYMKSEKPFLKQGYSINELSRDTGIPQHHLSALINRVYEMRFNEFLNRLRINYISENFTNPAWENLTIEGIAKQAGFTSRTTFFNAIKKATGLSPSEFIGQIKHKQGQAE